MKVVNILGGLGNQMFQYAFAIALKERFPNEDIRINTLCFNGYSLHNGYELNHIFKTNIESINICQLLKVAYPWVHYRLWQIGSRILPKRKSMIVDTVFQGVDFDFNSVSDIEYFDGYWQSPKFFGSAKSIIKKAFTFPKIIDENNQKTLKFIKRNRVAFIHVRRGDYNCNPLFGGICTDEYYAKGITLLKHDYGFKCFLIFSNDMDWCKCNLKKHFNDTDNVKYVDWNKGHDSFRDIQLMSNCNGAIIANSSFSWWGAWLGEADIVICPAKWTNKSNFLEDICPLDWVRITN